MPLKREKMREYMRERRRRQRDERKAAQPKPGAIPPFPADPAAALAEWSRKLKIPPGHPNAGKPLILPDYILSFIRDVFLHRESFLCIGRKNAKSAGRGRVPFGAPGRGRCGCLGTGRALRPYLRKRPTN